MAIQLNERRMLWQINEDMVARVYDIQVNSEFKVEQRGR